MSQEKDENKDLSEYVKLSIDELETLLKSYEDKIEYREKNHWLNRAQEKLKIDIRRVLKWTAFVILGFFSIFMFIFIVFSFMHHAKPIENFQNWFIPMMILLIPLTIIFALLEDDTRELYRERNKIALILKNKHKPKKTDSPNPRAVFILKLLAQHSNGLNKADIRKLSQREFGKSLDPKTIDEYLNQLSSSIKIEERAYRSPTGGNDRSTTKVYLLK
ncbi:MAG: hypothetical protein PHO02_05950 [Candidatus Nanoarchaeia archaeon]|nr:hypothetical protein [Candidatus Nanoarchaeia archaeon]